MRLPAAFRLTLPHQGGLPSGWLAWVSVRRQTLLLGRRRPDLARGVYEPVARYRISTSRFGIGARKDSNRTPLGLHRVARKLGGGWPIGTVFQARQPVGWTWQGLPAAPIAHRILWLEGLQTGLNRGGDVDTFERFVYIHGVGDETTLGRPASRGCVHLAARDLLPLYDRLPAGTWVWIAAD